MCLYRGPKSVIRRPAEQLNVAGFGADTLRVNNKIFSMPVRGRLVVKLPKARVEGTSSATDSRPAATRGRP